MALVCVILYVRPFFNNPYLFSGLNVQDISFQEKLIQINAYWRQVHSLCLQIEFIEALTNRGTKRSLL